MPQLFDFADIFADWETDFERIPKGGGHYDYANGGKWVPGYGDPVPMRGIIVPLSNDELQFEHGGVVTRQDRKVYLRKPLVLVVDDRIKYVDLEYRILEQGTYEEYADFNIYIAKRIDTKGRDPLAGTGNNP